MLRPLSAQVSFYSSMIQNHKSWNYAGVYSDEAITGTKEARESFQRQLNDCRNGKIDLIITKSVSRFARNTVDSLVTIRKLKEHNVEVYFEKENIYTFDGKGELLQKEFTVDFLQKKKKKNEGEVPQYYVEGSHEPVIPPRDFDLVQDEIKRRSELGRKYSASSIFSTKLICGD